MIIKTTPPLTCGWRSLAMAALSSPDSSSKPGRMSGSYTHAQRATSCGGERGVREARVEGGGGAAQRTRRQPGRRAAP